MISLNKSLPMMFQSLQKPPSGGALKTSWFAPPVKIPLTEFKFLIKLANAIINKLFHRYFYVS